MNSYNLDDLKEMAEGDEEFLREMLKTFIEELPEDVAAMKSAIANHNAVLTYQIAHKMKPNLKIFGLNLDYNVKQLEQWSKNNLKKEEVVVYAQEIENTVMTVCNELKRDYNL